jgi:iron complex outermembrane receptor protein
MLVGYERGHTPEVGYHTLAAENSRHMQILVDGRSIYQPALARILWNELPLVIDKIARIEVIRGPNTVMYGANSYLAVINIITLHPEDLTEFQARLSLGNHGIADGQARVTQQRDNFAFDVTVARHADDGFEQHEDGSPRYDAHKTQMLYTDLIWHQQNSDYVRVQLGLSDSDKQIDDNDASEPSPFHWSNIDNRFLQLNWQRSLSQSQDLKLQAFTTDTQITEEWQACLPDLLLSQELFELYSLDPQYTEQLLAFFVGGPAPITNDPQVAAQSQLVQQRLVNNGVTTVCGQANQNISETRADIELQLTSQISEQLRLVSGISYRNDRVSSESYFNGQVTKSIWRLFGNSEYAVAKWRFNLGLMYENDSLIGSETSPRLAVNYLISNNHSLRAIYSRANRSPDLFEEAGNRSYTLRQLSQPVNDTETFATYYQHAASPGNLDYEQVSSSELGWYYRTDDLQQEWDLKLFNDRLSQLLEGRTSVAVYDLSNQGRAELSGIEGQLSWQVSPQLRLWLSGSHIQYSDSTDDFYRKTGAKSTAAIGGFYSFHNGLKVSSSYYHYSNWFHVDFKRLDASVNYTFHLGDYQLITQLSYQHRLDENFILDVRNYYRNPDKIYFSVELQW